MVPAMTWLTAAPIPTAVVMAPRVRFETAGAACQVGDHQHGHNAEDSRSYEAGSQGGEEVTSLAGIVPEKVSVCSGTFLLDRKCARSG